MDKYIDAGRLLDLINDAIPHKPPSITASTTDEIIMDTALRKTRQILLDQLMIGEVKPVIHSYWIFDYGDYVCAHCGKRSYDKKEEEFDNTSGDHVMFCPYCGAIMDA